MAENYPTSNPSPPGSPSGNAPSRLEEVPVAEQPVPQQQPPQDDVKPQNELMSLRVIMVDGETLTFKVKRGTKMSKIMQVYSQQSGRALGTFKFMVDGNQVKDEDTPASLELEDDEAIDVVMHQIGGRSF